MVEAKKGQGRPADRRLNLVNSLRGKIVSGDLAPGSVIPSQNQLRSEYGVSADTIQGAINRLRDDGFVETHSRSGTFVSKRPPHLHRFGVVFPYRRGATSHWSRFWDAIAFEVAAMQHQGDRELVSYYDTISHEDAFGDFPRLLQSVESERLAGMFFVTPPVALLHTPVMQNASLPRVVVADPSNVFAGAEVIYHDWSSFFDKALGFLAAAGRRRVAMLGMNLDDKLVDRFLTQASALNMQTGKHWVQRTPYVSPENVVRLLMFNETRPDALIISDDHLLLEVVATLKEMNVRVPEDVQIVSHCNWPLPFRPDVPVKLLGFDARQILETGIEMLESARRGEVFTGRTLLPAVFDHEYKQRTRTVTTMAAVV